MPVPIKYTLIDNNKIITYPDRAIFIKPRSSYNIEEVYKYLDDHAVNNYLKPAEVTDKELIFPYFEKTSLTDDEISKRLVLNLTILQNKTTTYQKLNLDEVKNFYEGTKKKINYLFSYYHDIVLQLETKVYYLPTEYLFLRNSSIINRQLKVATDLLEEWYKIVKNKERERLAFCHGKCELAHFLPIDDGYFISLEKAHLGRVTDDIENLFRKNFSSIDLTSTYNIYQQKYPYTLDEKLFLLVKLAIPPKIDIYPCNLETNKRLLNFYEQLIDFNKFILEEQEQEKKSK